MSVRAVLAMAVCGAGLVLGGCKADYGADVRNKTPQPVFVQLFIKDNNGARMAGNVRLGPGDRRTIGPVRHDANKGAYLVVDTLPNPARPAQVDLTPGMTFFEVQQQGEASIGSLILIQK